MMQSKQRIPGQTLSANDIEAMLKDPHSLFFREYYAALMLYADMKTLENEEILLTLLTKLTQDAVAWHVHKQEACEREEKAQAQLQTQILSHQHPSTTFKTDYPELVPQLAQLAFYLDEWRSTDMALAEVQTQQQIVIEEWHDTQNEFVDEALRAMEAERLFFDNGSQVPLMTERDKEDIRIACDSDMVPVQALEKNPYKMEQLQQQTRKIIESLGQDEETMSLSDKVTVQQAAVEQSNINNQAVLNVMIKLIMGLTASIKKNLSEEEYKHIQWPHPKRTVQRNIEDMLLQHIDLKQLKERIRGLNNGYIANHLQAEQLHQQRDAQIGQTQNALESIYATLARDPEMQGEISELIDKLPGKLLSSRNFCR